MISYRNRSWVIVFIWVLSIRTGTHQRIKTSESFKSHTPIFTPGRKGEQSISGSYFFIVPDLPPRHNDHTSNGDQSTGQLQHFRQDGEVDHGTNQHKQTPGGLDNHGSGSFNETKCRVRCKSCQEWTKQRSNSHVEGSFPGDMKAFLPDNHGCYCKYKQVNHSVQSKDSRMDIPDPAFCNNNADGC